jgi:hypothetical protein
LSGLALAPLPFFAGFYSHHDGLILANVRLLREAFLHSGPWPFNQYGSFGILPQAIFAQLFPSEYQLLGIRIFTLLCYWVTGYFLFKLCRIHTDQNSSYVAAILYFISQPFNGSNFLPWASSFLMPMIVIMTFLISRALFDESITRKQALIRIFIAGILLPAILLSRAQIGILVLLFTSIFVLFNFRVLGLLIYFLGASLVAVPFCGFMSYFGWLRPSISDEFVFGTVYLKYQDVSHIPIPIFSGLGALIILIIFYFKNHILKFRTNIFPKKTATGLVFLSTVVMCLSFIFLMHTRHLTLQSSYFTGLSRFWISLYLGVLIYALLNSLRRIFSLMKIRKPSLAKNQKLDYLVLIAAAAQFQIWPFFDAMHFWWGSVPGVVVVVLIFKKSFTLSWAGPAAKRFIVLVVVGIIFIPWVAQSQLRRGTLDLHGTKGISINASDATLNSQTSKFLQQNLRTGSVVLNLCQNPDVFLAELQISSATRYFVFWPQMRHIKSIQNSFETSKPDTIVTCTLDEFNTDTEAQAEVQQGKLLAKVAPKRTLRAQANLGKTWKIWDVN